MIAHRPSMPHSSLHMAEESKTESAPRIASYQADPGEVGRVLLLYSGGLDTSVMLHWIQARYGAAPIDRVRPALLLHRSLTGGRPTAMLPTAVYESVLVSRRTHRPV